MLKRDEPRVPIGEAGVGNEKNQCNPLLWLLENRNFTAGKLVFYTVKMQMPATQILARWMEAERAVAGFIWLPKPGFVLVIIRPLLETR